LDSALQRIAEVAERGGDVPQLRLLTPPAMIYGEPVSSRRAAEVMIEDLKAGYRKAKKPARGDRERVEGLYERLAESVVAPFAADGQSPDSLSLVEARVIRLDGGTTFETPLLRVPISSVTAWFIGSFKAWRLTADPVGNATPGIEPPGDLESRTDLQERGL